MTTARCAAWRRAGQTGGSAFSPAPWCSAAGALRQIRRCVPRYLGPGWELAKVRGSRFNVGDGLKMALNIGACPYGNWSGRHAVSWERYAPEFGDLNMLESSYRHSFPLSLMINADGKRFVDEGIEFYNYTYAKYGAEVLNQPQQFAYQVFDAKTKPLLRPEYGDKSVTKVVADTLEELADKMEGVNKEGFLKTVREFNAAVQTDIAFDHSIKDGRCTKGLELNKSNWANPLDTPPFEAYATTCGITFTFGGLRTVPDTGPGSRRQFPPDQGALCLRRDGRRDLLFQLSGRNRARLGHRVRTDRRHVGRRCLERERLSHVH